MNFMFSEQALTTDVLNVSLTQEFFCSFFPDFNLFNKFNRFVGSGRYQF
ncbi:MAG: hypothetical protein FD181_2041 [Prolixibacteraceae bacterium]|nr:MAG: hypothetical protein FD181_2041 [Prolixibacteraceae bacterium]